MRTFKWNRCALSSGIDALFQRNAHHLLGTQDAVHGGCRAEVDVLVEQSSYDLPGRPVHEAIFQQSL